MAAILKKLGDKKKIKKKETSRRIVNDDVSFENMTTAEKNNQTIKTHRELSSLPEGEIDKVIFTLYDNESIDNISVCEVKNVNKSYSLTFSVDDPRLGTIDNNKRCPTCRKGNQNCPGHLGKIDLPVSIILPQYRAELIMVLKTICPTCNKLLITEKIARDKGFLYLKHKERLKEISKHCEKVRCTNPSCGPKPIFFPKSSENETRYVWYKIKVGKKEIKEYFTVETIKMKLDAISDKDSRLLGFENNHPKNMISDFLAVMPLCSRPYTVREGERSDDFITVTLHSILNKKIESSQQVEKDQKEDIYKDIIDQIRFMVDGMKVSEQSYGKTGKKENIKSIFDRIARKDGIIRKHMLGKRIDYTGRAVIGPNGTLEFNQIALPELMKQVTIPEIATKYNIEKLRELGRKGEISYICPLSGNNKGIRINFNINRHTINLGDKVGRFTQTGDIVLGNRQPTLHVQSMIGQEVVYQDKGSIGLHLSSTPGLNADFDGDEGNIHFLQTPDSQVEARIIMPASATIMSNSDSKPQSYLVYNSVIGAYLLSDDDTIFTSDEFQQGVKSTSILRSDYIKNNLITLFERAEVSKKDKTFSGKLLCSILFPPNFWYKRKDLFIVNGIIRSGRIKKEHVGSSSMSLIQCFVKWHGNKVTSDFISAANYLFNWYIERSGLSVGISDCRPEGLSDFIIEREKAVEDLNMKFISMGSEKEELKKSKQISKKLDLIADTKNIIQSKLIKIMPDNNNLNLMKKSGVKGNDETTMIMIGYSGQISVGKTLPVKKLSGGRRWLTTFNVNDNTVYATGFTSKSFLEGLDPDAYFALAQQGRLNVIDRQLKTADTGYTQRKIIKAQEDNKVGTDGAVYSQTGHIIQFTYGSGFGINQMVLDLNDEGEKFFSFINTQELCGRLNSSNGYKRSDLSEEVYNIFKNVLGEDIEIDLKFQENELDEYMEDEDNDDFTIEEEFNEDNYVDDDGEDFDL